MNRSLNYWQEMDEAEAAYEAARAEVLELADNIENYSANDMRALYEDASDSAMMNAKQLMLESLRGTRKGDFCARTHLLNERLAGL